MDDTPRFRISGLPGNNTDALFSESFGDGVSFFQDLSIGQVSREASIFFSSLADLLNLEVAIDKTRVGVGILAGGASCVVVDDDERGSGPQMEFNPVLQPII